MRTAGILLAAGRSSRFGSQDKLTASLAGRALVTHAASALRAVGTDLLLAVTDSADVAACLHGFRIVPTRGVEPDQADSLRAGLAAADRAGAARVLIVLGDMPCITADHLRRVLNVAEEIGEAASSDGQRRMPPAVFGSARFAALGALTGDAGARKLLADLPERAIVPAEPGQMADVDTPGDLQSLAMNMGPPRHRGKP